MMLRALTRCPLTTSIVIVTLGLGLGAVGVVASLCSAVLFPALPYRDPHSLAVLWSSYRPGSSQRVDYLTPTRAEKWLLSPPTSFSALAAVGYSGRLLSTAESTQRITTAVVSGSFFPMLGVRAARGRALVASDSTAEAQPVAVLSDRAWRKFFRADPEILGRTFDLDSVRYTIVGVTPANVDYPRGTDVWLPSVHVPAGHKPVAFELLGRVRDGSNLDRVQAEVIARSQSEHRTDSVAYGGQGVTALAFAESEQRLQGLLPLVAVGIGALYLIAALNLGILLLLEARRRAQEWAIRAALGASSWAALRPFIAQIGAQFIVGGVVAVAMAFTTITIIRNRLWFELAPLTERAQFGALAAVVLLAVTTAILLVPLIARRVRAADLTAALRRAGSAVTADLQSQRLRRLLVGVEIAIAIVLACMAGVIGKALRDFRSIELGYDADRVVSTRPDYAVLKLDLNGQAALAEEATTHLRGSRSVVQTTYWRRVPQPWPPPARERVFAVEGRSSSTPLYQFYEVGPRFFEALGIQRLQGRLFNANDARGTKPVAIVNRYAAEHWWPGQSPIGQRVSLNPADPTAWLTVVGVVDVLGLDRFTRDQTARDVRRSNLFRPLAQGGAGTAPYWLWKPDCFICPNITLAARASGDPERAGQALRDALRELAPRLPVESVTTMYAQDVGGWTSTTLTRYVRTIGMFGALAVMLALLGLYGVVADSVAARTRELAIRRALGASTQKLRRMLWREYTPLALAAMIGGAILYFAVIRIAGNLLFGGVNRALLFGGSPIDPAILVPMLLLALVVVAIAVAVGSRQALRLDPLEGLHTE